MENLTPTPQADTSIFPKVMFNGKFARANSAHLIATGFGAGLLRPAPGTWGSLLGWISYYFLLQGVAPAWQFGWIVAAFLLGCWACSVAGKNLGVADHGGFVWDEVVAMWLVLLMIPTSFWAQFWGFALFRFFDILKPAPIRQIDALVKGGFGVMVDDIVAAGYAVLVFAVFVRVW